MKPSSICKSFCEFPPGISIQSADVARIVHKRVALGKPAAMAL
jgi:hypothetical protein